MKGQCAAVVHDRDRRLHRPAKEVRRAMGRGGQGCDMVLAARERVQGGVEATSTSGAWSKDCTSKVQNDHGHFHHDLGR
jgi:hypothetical protein